MDLKANPSIKLKIVYQDKNVLAIDKPAGLVVHPIKPDQNDTLVNGLIAYYPEIKDVGDDSLRPGIVHRLDKDTSGLMVVAKNNPAFEHLKNQFRERKVVKKYLALVIGQVKDDKGTITKSISLSKKDHRKRSALLDANAKKAWTEYQVAKRFKDYTLLEVSIKTGRTHQIRVHLASIGHPIAGDKQYKFKRRPELAGLKRQFLHAAYLKLKLPGGKLKELKSELPKDLWTKLIYLIKNN
ncbi:MAG: RluA family pseudouridine synthase [Candidatus Portnoybacteria bacterium CG03_land_8_20_14_0_80_41_10]|uniref:Pseudouridine synthase n=1 Tax=Candidatus Portnoybacteria bacterium CG03_land_8_20_14_0_80_41_10 TaxID=1974808 RepID=A0A2M7BV97_9BACT|nr:MAG: RluA family pseudouridine synthase [Candidatus Portnoybacteria bacterium CG03_land_8_20_14_0_80_41_10]